MLAFVFVTEVRHEGGFRLLAGFALCSSVALEGVALLVPHLDFPHHRDRELVQPTHVHHLVLELEDPTRHRFDRRVEVLDARESGAQWRTCVSLASAGRPC